MFQVCQNHRDEHIDEQSVSVCILQFPPSISDIKLACEWVKNSLEVSPEEIKQIDQQTVKQSLSDKRYAVRRHRLTASVFHSAICRREKTARAYSQRNLLEGSFMYTGRDISLNTGPRFNVSSEGHIQTTLFYDKDNKHKYKLKTAPCSYYFFS